MGHWSAPAGGVAIYLVLVWAISSWMTSREQFNLRATTVIHNLLLSLGSLAILLGVIRELQQRFALSGDIQWFFCEDLTTEAIGPLFFWSYVYYISKFYEMVDTLLVLLQKSKVPHFRLQVYHHAAVVPMAWLWCQQRQSLQWGGMMFNTLVHVIMYQYYAFRVLGLPTPWKRWITKLQILQFVTSFVLLCFTLRLLLER